MVSGVSDVPGVDSGVSDVSIEPHTLLKIGVYSGPPSIVDAHPSTGRAMYAGPVMNRCARIASLAPEGHILTTSSVWSVACETCVPGRFRPLGADGESDSASDGIWCSVQGWYTFKGVRQPFEIVHVQDSLLACVSLPA